MSFSRLWVPKDAGGISRLNYRNRLRVKVDTSDVGEDLPDGTPLYIPLTSDNAGALLHHWELPVPYTFSFTGLWNGAPPDFRHWRTTNTDYGSVYVKNDLMHFECAGQGGTYRSQQILNLFCVSGAFDIEVAFENLVFPTNDQNPQFLLYVQNECATAGWYRSCAFTFGPDTTGTSRRFITGWTENQWSTGTYATTSRTNTYGRIRLVRSGVNNVITAYVKDGNAANWTQLASDAGNSNPKMYFYLQLGAASTGVVSADVSEVKINAGVTLPRANIGELFGSAILVTDKDDNPLRSYMTPFSATEGGLFVRMPRLLTSNPTELRVYFDRFKNESWDNPETRGAGTISQYIGPRAYWNDSNTILCCTAGDTDAVLRDASMYQHTSIPLTLYTRGLNVSSLIKSYGMDFRANTHIGRLGNSVPLNSIRNLTLEVIFRPTVQQASGKWGRIVTRSTPTNADPWDLFALYLDGNTGYPHKIIGAVSNGTAGSLHGVSTTTTFSVGTSYYIVLTYDCDNSPYPLKIYVDGVLEGTANALRVIPQSVTPLTIGNSATNNVTWADGEIHFLRIHRVVRSAAWIKAQALAFQGSLYSFAAAENYG